MSKQVQISRSGANSFSRLPGNTAELSAETENLDDTIFGAVYSSNQPAEITWSITTNAIYKGFAGYVAKILKTGTATAFTDEAVNTADAPVYQITAASKRLLDPETAVVVKDDTTDITDEVEYIDYLNGTFKLKNSYTVVGTISITGASLATTQLGTMNTFTLTQTAEEIDESDLEQLQTNNGFKLMSPGLRTVSLELSGFHKASAALLAELTARKTVIIEIGPDGNDKSVARGFFKPSTRGQSGDVGQLEEETINFDLFVPDIALLQAPFKWYHASDTTLNTALKDCLDAWEEGEEVDVRYLYDGTNGWAGSAIITDISLSGGLGSLNEFSISLTGDGELVAYP